MGKSKGMAGSRLIPMPPVVYINDQSENDTVAQGLSELIPNASIVSLDTAPEEFLATQAKSRNAMRCTNPVYIFVDHRSDKDEAAKKSTVQTIRQAAVKIGSNFASINTYTDADLTPTTWGGNHLDLSITDSSTDSSKSSGEAESAQTPSEKIYKWLFTVLTIKDTLHLIPDDQMKEVEEGAWLHDYDYCTIAQCLEPKKDARIYFIALIVTKPQVVDDNLITWHVADKTGASDFQFKSVGPSSKATWDWILTLEPGHRRSLPRMQSFLVKEKPIMTIAKAPLRVPGAAIQGAGLTVAFAGAFVSLIGEWMRMGKRKQWVLDEDVAGHLAKHKGVRVVPSKVKAPIKVFTGKGNKTWDDKDSSHSTLMGDSVDEKTEYFK